VTLVTDLPAARSERERAVGHAGKAGGGRERTVGEMRSCLERKRVEPRAIEEAIAELVEAGFLDDARYARRFAEDRRALERWGSLRIAQDLRRRGVEPELIEDALSGLERSAELGSAITLLEERFPAAPSDDRAMDKAWRLLVRRGYEPELAYEAVRAHGRQAA
jgi:regulatory protein